MRGSTTRDGGPLHGTGGGALRLLAALGALLGAGCEGQVDPSLLGPAVEAAAAEAEAAEAPAVVRSELVQVTSFGTNPGALRMFKHVPTGLPAGAPLVVALHGCTQTAAAYEATGWTALANLLKFAVVYPEQPSANNQNACFNWFEPGDITRGQGEALSIKQMVDRMKADHGVDPARVFVTGLSAGAAMTHVMAATYPDVFAAGAVMAGVPYKCATTMTDAFSCMAPGKDLSPAAWRDLVRGAFSTYTGAYPRMSLWHGTEDYVVKPTNLVEGLQQWTAVHGIDATADVTETVAGYPHKVYRDAAGRALVETYEVTGMGHGTPVDPAFKFPGTTVGCGTAGAYVLDTDVCSTWQVARFFGLDASDTVAPTVALTAPAAGAAVSGQVAVLASASDAVGVARVEFFIDNVLVGSDSAAPYEHAWNAATATNGPHTLLARAHDRAGNSATSAPVSVTVSGGVSDTTAPTVGITFPTAGATVAGSIDLAARASDDTGVTRVEFLVDGAVVGVGVSAEQAGPYTFHWNTTTVATGSHTVQARAQDAAGNVATSAAVSVTVDQAAVNFTERFSSATGPDRAGWSLAEWSLDASDQTGATGSRSLLGTAQPAFNTVTRTASVSLQLGANPRLTYWRKLDLSAANTSASAAFRVVVNDAGARTTVDQAVRTGAGTLTEAQWTERANVNLSAWANRAVTLEFVVTGTDTGSNVSRARAWVDSIVVGPPSESADTTSPAVNVTAPASGATVGGSVDVTASASDAVGVTRVEFYVDGALAGTDAAAPYVFTWNTAGAANGAHTLMAKAYDAANNVGTDNDTSVTVSNAAGGALTATFSSVAADDGYVKATATGGSAAVGTLTTLAVGRGTDGLFNRTLLSFDTSALPDGATVTRAWLKVTLSSASGDPWADPAGNTLVLDVKTGTFGLAATEASDWAAAPTAAAVADVVKFTSGSQTSSAFSAAGLSAVNRTGKTQVRLRFTGTQASTRYLFLTEGSGATLTVEYR